MDTKEVLIPKKEPEKPYYVTNYNHFEKLLNEDKICFSEEGKFLYKDLRIVPIKDNPSFCKIN